MIHCNRLGRGPLKRQQSGSLETGSVVNVTSSGIVLAHCDGYFIISTEVESSTRENWVIKIQFQLEEGRSFLPKDLFLFTFSVLRLAVAIDFGSGSAVMSDFEVNVTNDFVMTCCFNAYDFQFSENHYC